MTENERVTIEALEAFVARLKGMERPTEAIRFAMLIEDASLDHNLALTMGEGQVVDGFIRQMVQLASFMAGGSPAPDWTFITGPDPLVARAEEETLP